METKDDLTGVLAQLPDGRQAVKIEIVRSDGYVTARRIEGPGRSPYAQCRNLNL